jgi:hypothetical protein
MTATSGYSGPAGNGAAAAAVQVRTALYCSAANNCVDPGVALAGTVQTATAWTGNARADLDANRAGFDSWTIDQSKNVLMQSQDF